MNCPGCGHPVTRVVRTVSGEEDGVVFVRRRRECGKGVCGKRWWTREMDEVEVPEDEAPGDGPGGDEVLRIFGMGGRGREKLGGRS